MSKKKTLYCRLCGDPITDANAGFATLDLCESCEEELGSENSEMQDAHDEMFDREAGSNTGL